jgi:hypothetical protein
MGACSTMNGQSAVTYLLSIHLIRHKKRLWPVYRDELPARPA